jgi:hypothetical protein
MAVVVEKGRVLVVVRWKEKKLLLDTWRRAKSGAKVWSERKEEEEWNDGVKETMVAGAATSLIELCSSRSRFSVANPGAWAGLARAGLEKDRRA